MWGPKDGCGVIVGLNDREDPYLVVIDQARGTEGVARQMHHFMLCALTVNILHRMCVFFRVDCLDSKGKISENNNINTVR